MSVHRLVSHSSLFPDCGNLLSSPVDDHLSQDALRDEPCDLGNEHTKIRDRDLSGNDEGQVHPPTHQP